MILYLNIIYFYFIWNKELTITIKKNHTKKIRVEKKDLYSFLYFPAKGKPLQKSSSFVLVQTGTLYIIINLFYFSKTLCVAIKFEKKQQNMRENKLQCLSKSELEIDKKIL